MILPFTRGLARCISTLTFPRRDFSGHLCAFPANVQCKLFIRNGL
jgi:hypothetical protein